MISPQVEKTPIRIWIWKLGLYHTQLISATHIVCIHFQRNVLPLELLTLDDSLGWSEQNLLRWSTTTKTMFFLYIFGRPTIKSMAMSCDTTFGIGDDDKNPAVAIVLDLYFWQTKQFKIKFFTEILICFQRKTYFTLLIVLSNLHDLRNAYHIEWQELAPNLCPNKHYSWIKVAPPH